MARSSPYSLYDLTVASFDDMTGRGYDPRKARGDFDVQALHMYAAERMRRRPEAHT